jgi:coenzyme PQQ synthesis protein D (PqqD)
MTTCRPHPSVVFTPLDEKEAILLHLDTKLYYTLNETGRRIWELACSGHGPEEIGSALTAEYDVSPEAAEAKARALIDELSRERLLVR